MKTHERYAQTASASVAINEAVAQVVQDHGLTFAELVSILASVQGSWAKFAIRLERGEGDKTC